MCIVCAQKCIYVWRCGNCLARVQVFDLRVTTLAAMGAGLRRGHPDVRAPLLLGGGLLGSESAHRLEPPLAKCAKTTPYDQDGTVASPAPAHQTAVRPQPRNPASDSGDRCWRLRSNLCAPPLRGCEGKQKACSIQSAHPPCS